MNPFLDDYGDHFEIGFEQFRLRPGLELGVRDGSGRALAHKAQFVMAYPGKGVLISLRTADPAAIAIQAGQRYEISGFNGRFDFSFTAEAQKVDPAQFTALLGAPATVTIHFVRKHHRTDLAVPATAVRAKGKGPVAITLRNLSMGGAAITSVDPLGAKGDPVSLSLRVTFDGVTDNLTLPCIIRRNAESRDTLLRDTGLEFVNVSRAEKLLLHYYITTLESDYSVI